MKRACAVLAFCFVGCGAQRASEPAAPAPVPTTTTTTTESPTESPVAVAEADEPEDEVDDEDEGTPPPPTFPAPALCVRAATCCEAFLAHLGVRDTSTCAALAAPVTEITRAHGGCGDELSYENGVLRALGGTIAPECVPSDRWRIAGPSAPLTSSAEQAAIDRVVRAARARAHAHDTAAALAALDGISVPSPAIACEAGFVAHAGGDDQDASARIDRALAAFGYPARPSFAEQEARELAVCLYNAGLVREALHRTVDAIEAYQASERLRDDPHVLARLTALGQPRPGNVATIAGVHVESGAGSYCIRSSDPDVVDRVLVTSHSRPADPTNDRDEGTVMRLTRGATLALPPDGAFERVTEAVLRGEHDYHGTTALLLFTSATSSCVVELPLVAPGVTTHTSPVTMAVVDGALRVDWTREANVQAVSFPGPGIVQRWPTEARMFVSTGRCDIGPSPTCTTAIVREYESVVDTSPTVEHDGWIDAGELPPPDPTAVPRIDRRSVALELSFDAQSAASVRDIGGDDAQHPQYLEQRVRMSSGDLGSLYGAEVDATVDPDLFDAIENACERPEMETLFQSGADHGIATIAYTSGASVGAEGVALFRHADDGRWSTIYVPQEARDVPWVDDDGTRWMIAALEVDLVPGDRRELLLAAHIDNIAWHGNRSGEQLVICADGEIGIECRALPIRDAVGRREQRHVDAIRFDGAGHVFVTPHGHAETQQDVVAWIAGWRE